MLLLSIFSGINQPNVQAQTAVAEGFVASEPVTAGSLVSIENPAARQVVPANVTNGANLFGVAVSAGGITLSVSQPDSNVAVASTGVAQAFVSTISGEIKAGDRITASLINGVGMKAVSTTKVLGVAQADFTANSPGASKQTVTVGDQAREVAIGKIPILVQVSEFTPERDRKKTLIPDFVQDWVNAIAGKEVAVARIIVAGFVLLAVLITIIVLLYSSTRSSITAIGRNPLAKTAVQGSLYRVLAVAVLVLLAGFAVIYFILTG